MSTLERVDALFQPETSIEKAKRLKSQKEKELQLLKKIQEINQNLCNIQAQQSVVNEVESFKVLEESTKLLKQKKLDVAEEKLREYDSILGDIHPETRVKVKSHQHQLKRHPENHHTGWNCDKIPGVRRCLSGMTDFNQCENSFTRIYGWRCN